MRGQANKSLQNISKADDIFRVLSLSETFGYLFLLDCVLSKLIIYYIKFRSPEKLTQNLYPASKEFYLRLLNNFIQPFALKSCSLEKIGSMDKILHSLEIKLSTECEKHLSKQFSTGTMSASEILIP